jgi:hypothetical protein
MVVLVPKLSHLTQICLCLIAKYPFYPSTLMRCSLLAVGEPAAPSAPYCRCRLREGRPLQSGGLLPRQIHHVRHLFLRQRAQILGAAATEASHGWGVGTLGKGGARPLLHLRGGRPTAPIRYQ